MLIYLFLLIGPCSEALQNIIQDFERLMDTTGIHLSITSLILVGAYIFIFL